MPLFSHKNKRSIISVLPAVIVFSSVLLVSQQVLAAPKANADKYSTEVDQPITFNPLQNDSADEGTYIVIRWAAQPESANSGTTTFTNNSITYTPPADYTGNTRFWYSIEDSNGERIGAHIKIQVGDVVDDNIESPTANNDNLTTRQDTPLTISPLLNDTGEGLTITAINEYSSQGSLQALIGTDQISYTPSATASGEDTFWYQITDRLGRTNAAKVTVAVTTNENNGPYPTAGSDEYTVDKNTTNNVFEILQNDTGSGLDFLTLYSYSQKGGKIYDNGGSVRYDAPTNFVGEDEFWYSIKDSIGRTNSAKVTITVNETNNGGENVLPDAVEDSLMSEINAPEFEIDVLANDTDENSDTLIVQRVDPARSGSVRLVDGKVLYTPPSTTASDTFRYTVADGRGGTDSTSVTIGVRDPENPNPNNPVVENEYITMTAGDTIIIKVLENDTDADGDILSLDQVTSGSQGSTTKVEDENGNLNWIEYTALPTATDTDEFYYGVPDGRGGNGSGKVTITFE